MKTGFFYGRRWILLVTLIGCAQTGYALPMTPPEWAAAPGAVYHYYTFADDSLTPLPVLSTNDYGAASAVITATNTFATGWQDPAKISNYGHPDHGAWDLGPDGTIDITVPIEGESLAFQFSAIAIYESGFFLMPVLSLAGGYNMMEMTVTENTVYQDVDNVGPGHTEWRRITWEAQVSGFEGDALGFRLESAAGDTIGSIVDTMEVHLIPEPYALWLLACSLIAARKIRQRRAIQRRMAAGAPPPPPPRP